MPTLTQDMIEQAARVDPNRTLATSFLDGAERNRVIALILFAHEIGRARAAVSEPGLAAIRLQWWRDVIEQIYEGKPVRAQPIAIALSETLQEANLPRLYLDAMIDAHEAELEATPFATWAELETYLDATHGHLARLCALACGVPSLNTALDEVARESAIAWGLSRLLVATPQWCTRRGTWLPAEVRSSIDLEGLYSGAVDTALVAALQTVRARVHTAHHATNRALGQAKPGQAFPVFAHTCLADTYVKGFMPNPQKGWSAPNDPSLLVRQIRMTLAVARGRV
jgi:phytoene/squalene synthetase